MSAKVLSLRLYRAMPPAPTGPIGGIADRRFRYVPAVATDISKTFRRVRAQIAKGERL
jgi:hypothetical protein